MIICKRCGGEIIAKVKVESESYNELVFGLHNNGKVNYKDLKTNGVVYMCSKCRLYDYELDKIGICDESC